MTKEKSQLLLRRVCLIAFDTISIIISFFLSSFIAYNGQIELSFLKNTYLVLSILLVLSLVFFTHMKLYVSLWRYASVNELLNVIISAMMSSIIYCALCIILNLNPPISTMFLYLLILLLLIGGSRFGYRFLRLYAGRHGLFGRSDENCKRVMIVGAGSAGEKILRETLVTPKINKQVVCFIDDDHTKHNRRIHNIPIVGDRYDIVKKAIEYKIDEIYVALPSIDDKQVSEVLNICKETRCKLKKLPGMYQFLNDEIILEKLKDVEVQDLLGRDPIKVNLEEIMGYVKDKVVMVTGGGGSIGSELCRQIAKSEPKQLIIVDIYENNAYDIQLELQRKYPELHLETMIASVRDANKIRDLFAYYRPDIVYHAAAHKHVPLMEDAPHEAIKNNVFGTLNVAKAADHYGVKRFILISTDKAVNPTNIMGASKRLCEMIVQSFDKKSKTEFVAVRFGNVLGSNGSVIPLFKKQIKNGGPITITHPDIIRYFMTIPEAVSLVLQAGAYGHGGEIFVLDMGKPVKILDMARNLIKLSGLEPDVDIEIKFIGLRPGEKLYEEMLMKEEGMQTTPNKMIHIGKPIELSDNFFNQLDNLYQLAYDEDSDIRKAVHEIVDTYHYDEKTTHGVKVAV
ncbi:MULTISPECIES: nucleoside-diphosphate sugar epimerase/dehydratase [Coprobacillaceae]|uniref:polysaccharide biosynthesis protein n=1 Tax=Coprobacillaceae TaxID=2810280 RepID=UPI000E487384|nr:MULTISPECIES: nucleoside-diphosphate sugar epimerase/dehydratase [Coprobacillaceae]RHM62817.1 polysaccharide biosynthesis protein [Coprobacillus sp. AF33-1AC]RHS96114.1 polysaccharide biosynthesis protein [Erysipelatoclostridium sp. AM42-17]